MNSLDSLTGKNIPASSNGSLRGVRAHLETTAIVESPCSLSLRGTSGERAGERGTFHRIGAANWNPLSLTLSPLLCRGERESTSGRVVVLRCAHHHRAPHLDTAPGAPVSDPAGIQKHTETRRIGDRRSAVPVESGAVSRCAHHHFFRSTMNRLSASPIAPSRRSAP